MQARKETFEEYTRLVAGGWLYSSATGEDYPHFYRRTPDAARQTLVQTGDGWLWGVDRAGYGRPSPDRFENPIACLLAAELAGWEV